MSDGFEENFEGSDVEDETVEKTTRTKKRKPNAKNDNDDAKPNDDGSRLSKTKTESMSGNILSPDGALFVRITDVKSLRSIFVGLCKFKNTDQVAINFAPEGIAFYMTNTTRTVQLCAFYNRENFTNYKISEDPAASRVFHISVKELEDFKKNIMKDILFIEIGEINNPESRLSGLDFACRRENTTGSFADLKFSMKNLNSDTTVQFDPSLYKYNAQLRCSSEEFANNIKVLTNVEYVTIEIIDGKIRFKGISELGQNTKTIEQKLQSSDTCKWEGSFNRSNMNCVVAAQCANRAYMFVGYHVNDPLVPVHFKYELGKEAIPSHLSFYLATVTKSD